MYVKSRDWVPVAVDRRPGGRPAISDDEERDHRRVLRRRVLPWPEDVEVAQRDRLEAVDPLEAAAVSLLRQLGYGVRRQRVRRLVSTLGSVPRIAVDRGRRGEDHAADAGIPGCEQHVQRAGDRCRLVVSGSRTERGTDGHRRLVEHRSTPRIDVPHAFEIPSSPATTSTSAASPRGCLRCRSGSCRRRGPRRHAPPARGRSRPDEAGAAGDERPSRLTRAALARRRGSSRRASPAPGSRSRAERASTASAAVLMPRDRAGAPSGSEARAPSREIEVEVMRAFRRRRSFRTAGVTLTEAHVAVAPGRASRGPRASSASSRSATGGRPARRASRRGRGRPAR